MNLPILNKLSEEESTYITFSKALLDLDEANTNGTEFYFSKVVAMRLPNWKRPEFYSNLSDKSNDFPKEDSNPNVVIPKMIQHYMENIIRQPLIEFNDKNEPIHEITELAFYKMLNSLGMSHSDIVKSITFCNDIVTSNFTKIENNNGWGEIICQIPNKCRLFIPTFREIPNIKDIISCNDVENFGKPEDKNGNKDTEQIPFYDEKGTAVYYMNGFKSVLDITNSSFNDTIKGSFDFNVLLLFYRDKIGIDKLHGINFIFPFESSGTGSEWKQTIFTQKTNEVRSIGYQFIFNLKTCNNEASKTKVYEQNDSSMWWNGFEKTLSGLNSFLEYKMQDVGYNNGELPDNIPHIFGD